MKFPTGLQRSFLLQSQKKLSWTKTRTAHFIGVHTRTLNDWENERFLMNFEAARKLSEATHIKWSDEVEIIDRYWYVHKGAQKGGFASIKKQEGRIGNLENQKRGWREWWEKIGKFRQPPQFHAKTIYKPHKSVELAEFIGIMLGDGGMHKYQSVITLHHIDDRKYIDFVSRRIQKLFRIKPALYHIPKSSVFNIVVSRAEVVIYLHSLGLPIGNKVKQRFDVPEWIKKNKRYSIACVRGLVDTDGSVFTHSYKVSRKWYNYKKLSFTSYSEPLRFSVAKILTDLGMSPRVTEKDVRLDSIADMRKYFSIIGSHNTKHLKRYAN
jgi:DNA-binding XRE family transcriptional regulator